MRLPIPSVLLFSAIVLLVHPVAAEPPASQSGPFADGKVIQALGESTIAERYLRRTSYEMSQTQIRFDVAIITVDSKTREQIYEAIGDEHIETEITKFTHPTDVDPAPAETESGRSSRHQTTTGSVVSTAVLNVDKGNRVMELIKNSSDSRTVGRPVIIAADGQLAAIEQQVQRPFLSQLNKVDTGEETAIESGIEVLNEGIHLAVQADSNGSALQVRARLEQARVSDVATYSVFGFGDGKKVIQIPSHEVKQVSASQLLLPNETLLLDPYIESTVALPKTSQSNVLDKVPYVSELFESKEFRNVTLNTLVFLTPRKLAPTKMSQPNAPEGSETDPNPVP